MLQSMGLQRIRHNWVTSLFNFSACNWVVHNFYFFLVQSWKIELFLESVHFFQVIHFVTIQLFIIVSYNPFYFCTVCCNLSVFISKFVDLILLSLFLMSLAKGLSVLFIFSKNRVLVLLTVTIVSHFFFSFFCSYLYDFFPSTNFGIFLFFFFQLS